MIHIIQRDRRRRLPGLPERFRTWCTCGARSKLLGFEDALHWRDWHQSESERNDA